MAKTNWTMNDAVLPEDMNAIGQEVNDMSEDISEVQARLDEAEAELEAHRGDKANPHDVTSEQINMIEMIPLTEPGTVYPKGVTTFSIPGGTEGAPNITRGYIIHTINYSDIRFIQFAYEVGFDSEQYECYHRNWYAQGWTKWTRVLSSGNSDTTLKLSNFYPVYRKAFGGSLDLGWKKFAKVSIGTGVYQAASFEVIVADLRSNYGHSAGVRKHRFYASCRRSTGVQDNPNDAIIYGTSAEYFRVVKLSTGIYELQVRQFTNHMRMLVECRYLDRGSSLTKVEFEEELVEGDNAGTIYTPTYEYETNIAEIAFHGQKAYVKAGSGNPEGVVIAPKGSIYLNYGTGSTFYTKDSGGGNTGWRAVSTV